MSATSNLEPGELSPYMRWAKQHAPARFDLSGSNLHACDLDALPGWQSAFELTGLNSDGWPPLKEAIAARYGSTPERIATASGCGGANFLVIAALVRPGDDVLVERPAYDPLLGALRLFGASVRRFDRTFDDGWRLDPERIAAALTPRTRLVVLTNPHNPTGVLDPPATLEAIARVAERVGAHVLVDEAYLDLAVPAGSVVPAATRSDSLISTSSLTKSHGLNGLRTGWVIAAPVVAERARRIRDVMDGIGPVPMDRLAAHAFSMLDRIEARARTIVEPGRRAIMEFLHARPALEWIPPSATVVFPRIRGMDDAGPFLDRLRRDFDTQLTAGAFFQARAHFRLSFAGEPAILTRGLAALGAALESLTAD